MSQIPAEWNAVLIPPTATPEEQALQAIVSEIDGAELDSVQIDGKIHRFKTAGDHGTEKSGWYKFFPDNVPAGAFGCWRGDITQKWRAHVNRLLTEAENELTESRIAALIAEREAETARQYQTAAAAARTIWDGASEAPEDHPYLLKKGVLSHGLRITGDGRLIMPIYVDTEISSLQYISADGQKQFQSGGRVAGGYFAINATDPARREVFICEGYATGASVAEATGATVLIAHSAGNLERVAIYARDLLPSADIIIVADNDESGVGQRKAAEAAEAIGGRVIMPPETGDANDYATLNGLPALKKLLLPSQSEPWLIKGRDFYKQPRPVKWLIKNWIQEQAMMMVFGPSGAGKTFFVLDVALTIASGLDSWHGIKTRGGPVVYLAGEGHVGLRSRIAAWVQQHGRDVDDIFVSRSACDLNKPGSYGYDMVVSEIDAAGAKPVLIVVDTLARFMAGDENSAEDAKTLIDNCSKLMQLYSCSVLLVHHTGVGEGAQNRARGSSAFKGALEVEIKISSSGSTLVAESTKEKDTALPAPLVFEKTPVEIDGWFDEDGDPVESVVLEKCDSGDDDSEQNQKRGKYEQICLEAFFELADQVTELDSRGRFSGVLFSEWRKLSISKMVERGTPQHSARTQFTRARKNLVEPSSGVPELKMRGDGVFFGDSDYMAVAENSLIKRIKELQ